MQLYAGLEHSSVGATNWEVYYVINLKGRRKPSLTGHCRQRTFNICNEGVLASIDLDWSDNISNWLYYDIVPSMECMLFSGFTGDEAPYGAINQQHPHI